VAALRVVLDTNLLVSYLLTQGKTISRIINFWEQGDIVVLVSPTILMELSEVVQRPRLRQQMKVDPQVLIDTISAEAVYTSGDLALPGASRDPKDDKFLACAVEGNADYLATGDSDLLDLGSIQAIPILRPHDFVELMEATIPAVE
jgi:putative PIN family toxin of toxin-antitoxin system